jgi:hypothetical protein
MIIADMLGIDHAMGAQLVSWSHDMVAMYMHGRTREHEMQAAKSAREFSDFIRAESRSRIGTDKDDLLTMLAEAGANGEKLTEDELGFNGNTCLLNAGHEATVHQTGNAVKTPSFSQEGDIGRFVRHDESRLRKKPWKKRLRFDAPLHMFTRYVYEADSKSHDGVLLIRSGDQVALLLGACRTAIQKPPSRKPGEFLTRARKPTRRTSPSAPASISASARLLARLEMQVSTEGAVRPAAEAIRLAEELAHYRDSYGISTGLRL